MNTNFLAFGEMLWDCLPAGRHAGGAPFNVAAHLAALGADAVLLSAVGQDALGDELLQIAQDKGMNTRFVGRVRAGLPTGTVQVTLDAQSNASYDIVQPAAWDEIPLSDEALAAVTGAQALVYGSLAARSAHNMGQLERLLDVPGPVKFFDVNLRASFVGSAHILDLARRADVLKLNEDELTLLVSWVNSSHAPPGTLADACALLAETTHTPRLCVTRGAGGAALWDKGAWVTASAPPVTVRDTIGAGDAFMAGLMRGLSRGTDPQTVLARACRLGAFVASQPGATPPLPDDIISAWYAPA